MEDAVTMPVRNILNTAVMLVVRETPLIAPELTPDTIIASTMLISIERMREAKIGRKMQKIRR